MTVRHCPASGRVRVAVCAAVVEPLRPRRAQPVSATARTGERGDQLAADREQLSNVVDLAMKNDQAATLSSVVVSSSVTLIPSLNFTPASTSPMSSWPLNRRQRSWAASKSL